MLDANGVEIVEAVPPVVPPVVVVPPEAIPLVIPEAVAPVIPKPEPTGNTFFDMAQNALHEKGVSPDKYLQEFIEAGAVSPESRVELVTALGEAQVQIIEQGMSNEVTRIKAAQAVEAQKVFAAIDLPGYPDGQAAFTVIAAWAAQNISKEDRAEFNLMLSKGGVQAGLAITALKEKYMADPSYSVTANLVPGTTVPVGVGPELISRSTYTAERKKAENARDQVLIAKLDARARYTMEHNREAWRP